MSDFPFGGDVATTREWLDRKGFVDIFLGWEADAIIGLERSDIALLLPDDPTKVSMLWKHLTTAMRENQRIKQEMTEGVEERIQSMIEEVEEKTERMQHSIERMQHSIERMHHSIERMQHSTERMQHSIERMEEVAERLLKAVVISQSPIPVSSASQEIADQRIFKKQLLVRYHVECSHPINPDAAKCMVLNHFFCTSQVVASHIISPGNHRSFLPVGLIYAEHCYDPHNGLLVHKDINRKYRNQLITFIYNHQSHEIRLQVLYDHVLTMQVGDLTKAIVGKTPKNAKLTYADINGSQLIFTEFTRLPFRQALIFVARTAWSNAMRSSRPHTCATALGLTNDWWNEVGKSFQNDCFGLREQFWSVIDIHGHKIR